MILELTKAEYKWFREFMQNYYILMKSHVLSGNGAGDDIKRKIEDILTMKPESSGLYLVPLSYAQVEHFIGEVDENTCACPGCTLGNVKKRMSVRNKLYKMLNHNEGELQWQ
jgi:hypothetical protein